ncbi:MAG: tetratricopeptide repeat protein [Holophaga sp.]|nr:tetratricopeptide repeat protein [Holophaga sp.]
MRLALTLGPLFLVLLACKAPAPKPALSPAQIWAAQVQEAGTIPAAAIPEHERIEFAQGFENGAAMVRRALDTGRKPFVLLPDMLATPPPPKLLGPLPEGVTLASGPPQVELDTATGLRIWAWGSAQGSTYSRGQKEGFAWALSHHGQSLVQPRRPSIMPEHWVRWPKEATGLNLETVTRKAEVHWAPQAIFWKATGEGFPIEHRWHPADEAWKPRFAALQEDVLWLDTLGHGAVALDLETGYIRDLKPSPNPAEMEATLDTKATAEKNRIQEILKETTPEASRKRWQEHASSPKAMALRKELREQAEKGIPEAMFFLALNLANLGGAEEAESATWLRKSAEQGHPQAMSFLGAWHYEGRCVEKSETLARKWLEKAAKAGDAEAKKMLASLFGVARR